VRSEKKIPPTFNSSPTRGEEDVFGFNVGVATGEIVGEKKFHTNVGAA